MNNAATSSATALTRLARDDGPRVLSVLASRFGDLDLADDAVQDALVDAARSWPRDGVPSNPGGWLMTVARNRAIDRRRKQATETRRLATSGAELLEQQAPSDAGGLAMIDNADDASYLDDERLRLMLLCSHPALDDEAQVALTLRLVGGLTTEEIAAAFLVPTPTMAQRIVRAKRKIRTAGMVMSMPTELDERLGIVLETLYLVFNEGYLSRSPTAEMIRVDLLAESIRLTRLVVGLTEGHPEALGLLALELFGQARIDARTTAGGELILLEDQDRSRWDMSAVDEANRLLAQALRQVRPGPYQLQALIGSHHANARDASETDWAMIVDLYDQLVAVAGSPVVLLNRAVAVAMAQGPLAGLRLVDELDGLDAYHLYWATKAELNVRAGRPEQAVPAFGKALELVSSEAERIHLTNRLASVRT